jgi:hypothetical protein
MVGFIIGTMLGLAVGLWAGRKNALRPGYFATKLATLLEKAKR